MENQGVCRIGGDGQGACAVASFDGEGESPLVCLPSDVPPVFGDANEDAAMPAKAEVKGGGGSNIEADTVPSWLKCLPIGVGLGGIFFGVARGHAMQYRGNMARRARKNRAITPADKVLAWYASHRRDLPWRAGLGEMADPYHVLLSEFMLQQTVVATVIPYFQRFLARWPSLAEFAQAPRDAVMQEWAGLGYYARARNLHQTAQLITSKYGGAIPRDETTLRTLPGIGAYTAAALVAFAFGARAVVLDANGERIIARYAGIATPLPAAKPEIREVLAGMTPDTRAGDFAQGLMDLGQMVCLARQPPLCMLCPLADDCTARRLPDPSSLPTIAPRKVKPTRHGHILVVVSKDNKVLLLRRGDTGLLGGMHVFPMSGWADGSPKQKHYPPKKSSVLAELLAQFAYTRLPQPVRHAFTHFDLVLSVACMGGVAPRQVAGLVKKANGVWQPIAQLDKMALPTVMRKVALAAGLVSGERHAGR